jgi:hypothetical protein
LNSHTLKDDGKRLYSNILRAKISLHKVALICYNMKQRTEINNDEFQNQVKHFNLLADLKDWPELYEPDRQELHRFLEKCDSQNEQ